MTDFMPVDNASRPADLASLLERATEAKKTGKKLLGLDAN
jgi:hypothetical protein